MAYTYLSASFKEARRPWLKKVFSCSSRALSHISCDSNDRLRSACHPSGRRTCFYLVASSGLAIDNIRPPYSSVQG
ncbi:hypothetical protein BJX70DRAFT_369500 [Aspergillus crustosus]